MLRRVLDLWASIWKPWPGSGKGDAPPGGDRRGPTRHDRRLEVSCRPLNVLGPPPRWPAVVQDVSAGGLGLLLEREVAPETLLEVLWPKPIAGLPETLSVRVARVSAQPGGYWLLGCAFSIDLAESQLQALLAAMH